MEKCPVGWPVEVVPLWQLLHVPGATPEWSNPAGVHAFVVWQTWQSLPLAMWFVLLPMARLPLWQVKQPSTMPVWSIVAGVQPFGVWHVSQVLPVGMWFVLLPVAVLPLWQLKQLSTMRAGQSGRCVQPDNAVGR